MKVEIGVESFEQMRERKLARARRIVNREPMEPEMRINFENPLDFLACITPERVRLCEVAREQPRSVTDLAAKLGRDRKAVYRDVKVLSEAGMIRLRKQVNPGHGQVQMVEATALRFELTSAI